MQTSTSWVSTTTIWKEAARLWRRSCVWPALRLGCWRVAATVVVHHAHAILWHYCHMLRRLHWTHCAWELRGSRKKKASWGWQRILRQPSKHACNLVSSASTVDFTCGQNLGARLANISSEDDTPRQTNTQTCQVPYPLWLLLRGHHGHQYLICESAYVQIVFSYFYSLGEWPPPPC